MTSSPKPASHARCNRAHRQSVTKVVDMDADGNMTVLHEGTNGWTCMPGVETARADMCADEMGMQWIMDAWTAQHSYTVD
jgi:hypothetical protein